MNPSQSEQIMQTFNLTADSLAKLPRGLPAELAALLAQRNALLVALQAIDKLSCNGPCMSLQAEHEFARCPDAQSYKIALCHLVLEMREQARQAIALAQGGGK